MGVEEADADAEHGIEEVLLVSGTPVPRGEINEGAILKKECPRILERNRQCCLCLQKRHLILAPRMCFGWSLIGLAFARRQLVR